MKDLMKQICKDQKEKEKKTVQKQQANQRSVRYASGHRAAEEGSNAE